MTRTAQDTSVFGSIEAGGTKWVCAIGSEPDRIIADTRFPTSTPTETLADAITFFQDYQHLGLLRAIGVGSFGPVDLNSESSTYGYITSTPKAGWANTDIVGALQQALGVPVRFDTDVNAAALGEYRWGAAQGCAVAVYLTIGTGIGGGIVAYERRLHGLVHPEIGHMRLPHDWQHDPFPGACPYHGDCLEGLHLGQHSLNDGASQRRRWEPITPPGSCRCTTWHWRWSISSARCQSRASFSVVA
jgi:fructokinase